MAKVHQKQAFRFSADYLAPHTASESDVYALQSLLGRYGYLQGGYVPGKYDKSTQDAVSQFQAFYHIYPKEDGVCDPDTTRLLTLRRCGVGDSKPGQRSRSGRLAPFVAVGAKWNKLNLSYKFLNSTPDLTVDRQRQIIRDAFTRWANVSALNFSEILDSSPSDLSVAFHHGSHGDGAPFDDGGGADGNTLAHAFYPPPRGGAWAGSLHFDEYETWKDAPGGLGTRLYNVALHEIGHLLGLAHSQDQNAIMYAYYDENRNDLRADDIAGVQSLYGAPVEEPVSIALGEQISGHLPQTNAEVHYQVSYLNKLLIKLDGPEGEDFDLYVRHGAKAGTGQGQYDVVSYGITAEELVTIEDPQPGIYYILVHSYRGTGSFTLEVEVD